jgi:hypothetical protein
LSNTRAFALFLWRIPTIMFAMVAGSIAILTISMFVNNMPGPIGILFGLVIGAPAILLSLRYLWMVLTHRRYRRARSSFKAAFYQDTPDAFIAAFGHNEASWRITYQEGSYVAVVMEGEDISDALLIPSNKGLGAITLYQLYDGVWTVFKWVGATQVERQGRHLHIKPASAKVVLDAFLLGQAFDQITASATELEQLATVLGETRPHWRIRAL